MFQLLSHPSARRVFVTWVLTLLSLCLVLTPGCTKTEKEPSTTSKVPGEAEQEKPLLLGLSPEHQLFTQVERFEPLVRYLSARIGRKVKMTIFPRYGNIIDNFASSGMDGAFFGSFTYVLAHQKLGLEVLARPECIDGSSTYHGLIFVRKDSGIRTAGDMKGKRFAFVDKATTAGYLLPLAYFKKNGIRDYRSYLGETYFTGTHEDAIYDVLDKKADVAAVKNTVYDRVSETDKRVAQDLVIIETSPEVPENGLAVRRDLDSQLKSRLKEALLTMQNDRAGREVLRKLAALRFIETTDSDYEPVVQYAREIGLDLATYDYRNDK